MKSKKKNFSKSGYKDNKYIFFKFKSKKYKTPQFKKKSKNIYKEQQNKNKTYSPKMWVLYIENTFSKFKLKNPKVPKIQKHAAFFC